MANYNLSHLRELEAEAIHIMREVVAEFDNPVMLYSVGKDSSVMVRLAQKAFAPGRFPFPLLHIDTSYKFEEMYSFRDKFVKDIGADLIVFRNEDAIKADANPWDLGTSTCCGQLKTKGLLGGLAQGGYDAAFGGARRDEEKSRAKERVYSFRDKFGQWDPKNQRPELWNLYNGHHAKGESIRVFPLSNWTELDVWLYIYKEEMIMSRFRTLGCSPCTGAVRSEADTMPKIIEELMTARQSERITRIIDHDRDGSMELKKREGYF